MLHRQTLKVINHCEVSRVFSEKEKIKLVRQTFQSWDNMYSHFFPTPTGLKCASKTCVHVGTCTAQLYFSHWRPNISAEIGQTVVLSLFCIWGCWYVSCLVVLRVFVVVMCFHADVTCQPHRDAICFPSTPEGCKSERFRKSLRVSPLPPWSVCLSVGADRDWNLGVKWASCRSRSGSLPSNPGNPLTSASRLCCGCMSVCTLLRPRPCVLGPELD